METITSFIVCEYDFKDKKWPGGLRLQPLGDRDSRGYLSNKEVQLAGEFA